MSSKLEFLNALKYRTDGRLCTELRAIQCSFSTPSTSQASNVTFSHGLTEVNVSIFGPRECRTGSASMDAAVLVVNVDYPGWAEGRKRSKSDRRTQDVMQMIKTTFEPVLSLHLFPRSEIIISIQILSIDGGILQTCINCASLALQAAGIPMKESIVAISASLYMESTLLDPNTSEEQNLPTITFAVLPTSGKISLVSMENRIHLSRFQQLLPVSVEAGQVLRKELDAHVRGWGRKMLRNTSENSHLVQKDEENRTSRMDMGID